MKRFIAFPSISTTDFGFPVSEAIDIIYESASTFLGVESKPFILGDIAIVLVLHPTCRILLHPKFDKLRKLQADSKGYFLCYEGEICKLRTVGNLNSVVAIVNPSNHRFTSRGGFINQIIHAECDYGNLLRI